MDLMGTVAWVSYLVVYHIFGVGEGVYGSDGNSSMGQLSSAIPHLWGGRRGIWMWWERDWVSRIPSEVWGGGKYSPPWNSSVGRLSSAISHLWGGRRGIWMWWERDWVSRIPSEVWGGGKYSPPSPLYTFIFYPPILALFYKNYHGFCCKGRVSRVEHDFWSSIEFKKKYWRHVRFSFSIYFFVIFPTVPYIHYSSSSCSLAVCSLWAGY